MPLLKRFLPRRRGAPRRRPRALGSYDRVPVRVAFQGFWRKHSLESFLRAHPYLKLKYELIECASAPHVTFVSVFDVDGNVTRRATDIPLPRDGGALVFYTGEAVQPDLARFDWSISFAEGSARNLYLPGWVRHLNRMGITPYSLLRAARSPFEAMTEREPCAYLFRHRVPWRERFFDLLAQRVDIVSPGESRNNHPAIGRRWMDKLAFLRRFRLNLAFENDCCPGYITEKLVHAFTAGCVPIYRGDPLVEETFSPTAFVHVRDDADYGSAVDRIAALNADLPRLERMRNEAPLVNDRLPDYAQHGCAMAFFERIFDDAARQR